MKKFIFVPIGCCLLFTICCYSQTWQWAQRGGGTDNDLSTAIFVDKWGNSYITGQYLSNSAVFGSDSLPQNGFSDIFIAKYDSNGNLLWAKHAGGNNALIHGGESGLGITIDSLGNSYVTGFIRNFATFDTITVGAPLSGSNFIAKYDINGSCLWAKRTGGKYGTSIYANKNLFVTGAFSGTTDFGEFIITAPPNSLDVFIAKYDLNGTCLWVRQGNSQAGGSSISADAMGNCYVTGFFSDSIKFGSSTSTLTSTGSSDVFVVKYDSAGNCLWSKSGGSTNSDGANGISVDAYGNCYITGYFTGSVTTFDTFSLTLTGSDWNIFIVKYDTDGNCKWAKQGYGSGEGEGSGISISAKKNGYINVAGKYAGEAVNFEDCSLSTLSNFGNFIAEFDSNGGCLWITPVNVSPSEGSIGSVRGIALDDLGNVHITGSFLNSVSFNSTELTSAGVNDVFVAKLNTLGAGVPPNNDSSTFIIYPNPSDGSYTMQISQDLLQSAMFIYNAAGQIIFQTTLSQNSTSLVIPNLAQGVYVFKLQTPSGDFLQRSIVRQ